jgi:hypothetical protein
LPSNYLPLVAHLRTRNRMNQLAARQSPPRRRAGKQKLIQG